MCIHLVKASSWVDLTEIEQGDISEVCLLQSRVEFKSAVRSKTDHTQLSDSDLPYRFFMKKLPYLQSTPEATLPLAWLHVPKCGSSFANTLLHTPGLCPSLTGFVVNSTTSCQGCKGTSCQSCTYFNDHMMSNFKKEHNAVENCPGLLKWSNHKCLDEVDEQNRGFVHTFKDYINHGVTMLRQPEDRLISSFHHNLRSWPIDTLGNGSYTDLLRRIQESSLPDPELLMEYAKKIQGCTAKMLTEACKPKDICGSPGTISQDKVEVAKKRLETFAFVGLTDQWNLSICLFRKMFGGECYGSDFSNTRDSFVGGEASEDPVSHAMRLKLAEYNITHLNGWVDEADHEVYDTAKSIFEHNCEDYGVSDKTCQACYQHAATHWVP